MSSSDISDQQLPPQYTSHPSVLNPGYQQLSYGQLPPNPPGAGVADYHYQAQQRPLRDRDAEGLDDGVTGSKQGYVTPKIPREYMHVSDHLHL